MTNTPPRPNLASRLRCLVFWPVWAAYTITIATALICLFWTPASWCYEIARLWCAGSLVIYRWTLGIRYRLIGAERLRDMPRCVVVSNHESAWETIAMTALLPPLTWVIKKELLFVPFFGQVVFLTRPIILNRSQRRRALSKMIERGQAALGKGRWVSIFPQGTRQRDVAKPRFHTGAAKLAIQARCPLLPVIHNAGAYWGGGAWEKRAGAITLHIGEPLSTVDEEGKAKPLEQVHREMTEIMHAMRAGLDDGQAGNSPAGEPIPPQPG